MNFTTEREYQNHIIKELKAQHPNIWLYKIPDVNMQIKPFDIIACIDGYSFACELKICNLKKGLTYQQAYAMLRPNQIGHLSAHKQAGGKSYVFVYNQGDKKEYRYEFMFLDNISSEL